MSAGRVITTREVEVHRVAQLPWLHGGVTSPDAFKPRPQDKGELSLFDKGDSPADAVAKWLAAFPTSGVSKCLTGTVGQFNDLDVEVQETPTKKFPTRCSAMFAGKPADEVEIIAALLAEVAVLGP